MEHNRNIIYMIRQREYHVNYRSRTGCAVLKTLICHEDAKFKKIWEKQSNFPIRYESGRIYFENYTICYTSNGHQGIPQEIYRLPPCSVSEKIEDALLCQSSLESLPLRHHGYRPCLLTLTADNWLLRYDADTGERLQQVHLSSRHKYRRLSWDSDLYTITIRSTPSEMSAPHRQAGIVPNLPMVLIVMTMFPLEFQAQLEVTEEVFDQGLTDANVSQGMLITMHQDGLVKLYSWPRLLQQGLCSSPKLGDQCDTGVVGSLPHGLPVNVHLTERPAVLFSVNSANHSLVLGGIPWHYIIRPSKLQPLFHVYSIRDKQLAKKGQLEMPEFYDEPNKCIFHADDSGRILYIGVDEIRVLKIKEYDEKPHSFEVEQQFAVHASSLQPRLLAENNEIIIPISRRTLKMVTEEQHLALWFSESMETVAYTKELNVLTVTSAHKEGDDFVGTLYLLHNDKGHVIKKIQLPEVWEPCRHQVILDQDTIIHLVNDLKNRSFKCYIHRLDRSDSPAESHPIQGRHPRTQCPVAELQRPRTRNSTRNLMA